MSTISSFTSLTTVSDDPLAKWPILYADLYAERDHNPDPGFFRSVPLEDLCLVGLGLTTCDLRLGPNRTFDNIHILRSSFSTRPLDTFGWINIPNAGLIHLTRALPSIDHDIRTFQGWRLPSFEAAMQQHRADFTPCVIFIPRRLFVSKTPAAAPRERFISKLWRTVQQFL